MTASTAKFLLLHFMAAVLMFGSLAVAGDGPKAFFYLPALALLYVALGTLKDFLHFYRIDLNKRG